MMIVSSVDEMERLQRPAEKIVDLVTVALAVTCYWIWLGVSTPSGGSKAFRIEFMEWWLVNGGALHGAIRDDLALLNELAVMLPRYVGPERLFYRGKNADNRKHRT